MSGDMSDGQVPAEELQAINDMAAALDSEGGNPIEQPSPADMQRIMQQAQQMVQAGKKPRGKNWKRRIIERRQAQSTRSQRRRHSKAMERKARRRFEVVTGRRKYTPTPTIIAKEVVSGQVNE